MEARTLFSSALFPPVVCGFHNLNNRSLLFITPQQQGHKVGYKAEFLKISVMASLRSYPEGTSTQVPTSVPVRVAYELYLAGHRYLDVRTPEEFSSGHAPGAINIPYMYKTASGMTKNPNFLKEVSAHFGKDAEILVGCQLGKRSMMAATDLLASGFTGITDVAGGFAAWTQSDLPTER